VAVNDINVSGEVHEPASGDAAGSYEVTVVPADTDASAAPRSNAAVRRRPAGDEAVIDDRLSRATALLRQHTDAGWKAIEDNVVARALTLFRPSTPVRGRHDIGDFFLAADVIVARLRRRIDEIPAAAAQKIACTTDDRDELELVTIQLIAAYRAPLLEVAGHVHAAAMDVLGDLLGALAPATDRVRTHVHIGDVSNDPRVVI